MLIELGKKFVNLLKGKAADVKPEFLIIGVQKGGTTSLYYYLSHHPSILAASAKEVCFFYDDKKYDRGGEWYLRTYFSNITNENRRKLCFEATPEYIYYPVCPERIYSYNKKMKMIVILRDPVERAFSSWNMYRNFENHRYFHYLREYRDFMESITSEITLLKESLSYDHSLEVALEPSYVRRGLYCQQLMRYLKFFPREQFYITENKLLQRSATRVMEEITDFLGVSHIDWEDDIKQLYNEGRYEDKTVPDEPRKLLTDFYRPHNLALFELLGTDYDWL